MSSRLEGPKYHYRWNTNDFVGKYHTNRFKAGGNAPIPGTTIRLEQDREQAKYLDNKRFEDELTKRIVARKNRLKVRYAGAALNVDVEMKTTIGAPMNEIESILNMKEDYLDPKVL